MHFPLCRAEVLKLERISVYPHNTSMANIQIQQHKTTPQLSTEHKRESIRNWTN